MLPVAQPLRSTTDSAGTTVGLLRELPQFDLVELNETIQPGERDKTAQQLVYRPDAAPPELFTPGERELTATADPQQGLYLAGERHLTYFHPGAGQRLPIPGTQFHFGQVGSEPIAAGGNGPVTIWRVDADAPAASSFAVTAEDWLGQGLDPGQQVYVFSHNQSRRWFALAASPSGAGATVRWAVCVSNWTYIGKGSGGTFPSAGGRARVTVQECDDSVGLNPHGDEFVVYLPSNAAGDPNLIAGDVIAFVRAANDTPVCVSSYMDDPIGTVKMFTGSSGQTRPGWVCMNGSQDSAKTLNNSAWSMVGLFPRGECSDGQIGITGGSDTHDHGGATGETAPDTAVNYTNVAVYDPNSGLGTGDSRHRRHNHSVDTGGGEFSAAFGADFVPAGGSGCTSTERDGESEGCGTEIDLAHAVYDPGHYHSVNPHAHAISPADNLPPWRNLRFIERIDNSA